MKIEEITNKEVWEIKEIKIWIFSKELMLEAIMNIRDIKISRENNLNHYHKNMFSKNFNNIREWVSKNILPY